MSVFELKNLDRSVLQVYVDMPPIDMNECLLAAKFVNRVGVALAYEGNEGGRVTLSTDWDLVLAARNVIQRAIMELVTVEEQLMKIHPKLGGLTAEFPEGT